MVPAPNGLNKAPKPKPSEPAPMTGVIHIGHDISKIERAESRGDRIEKGEKRSYFSLEEEFGPDRFFDRESSWLDSTPACWSSRRTRTCSCWSV